MITHYLNHLLALWFYQLFQRVIKVNALAHLIEVIVAHPFVIKSPINRDFSCIFTTKSIVGERHVKMITQNSVCWIIDIYTVHLYVGTAGVLCRATYLYILITHIVEQVHDFTIYSIFAR